MRLVYSILYQLNYSIRLGRSKGDVTNLSINRVFGNRIEIICEYV